MHLTLVIPDVDLPSDAVGTSAHVNTIAIIKTHTNFLTGAPSTTSYKVDHLTGTANIILIPL